MIYTLIENFILHVRDVFYRGHDVHNTSYFDVDYNDDDSTMILRKCPCRVSSSLYWSYVKNSQACKTWPSSVEEHPCGELCMPSSSSSGGINESISFSPSVRTKLHHLLPNDFPTLKVFPLQALVVHWKWWSCRKIEPFAHCATGPGRIRPCHVEDMPFATPVWCHTCKSLGTVPSQDSGWGLKRFDASVTRDDGVISSCSANKTKLTEVEVDITHLAIHVSGGYLHVFI